MERGAKSNGEKRAERIRKIIISGATCIAYLSFNKRRMPYINPVWAPETVVVGISAWVAKVKYMLIFVKGVALTLSSSV